MDTAIPVLVALVALVVVVGAVIYMRRRKSRQMREHYGAEYIAAVDELGDRRKAETELAHREKRVQAFHIEPLSPGEADRYADRWRRIQAEFVDDPGRAIASADGLLGEVMQARGYPVSDFEQRAADLSVDHPKLVADYRLAHEVAVRHARGEGGTEDLRRALIHYRDLFAELVEPPQARGAEERRTFKEEPEDERAARAGDQDHDRRADDRATRRGGGKRPDGRAPLV